MSSRLRVWGLEVSGEPCQWALTQKRTLRGGGALEFLDLRLFEDGGERGGALGSNGVGPNTASEGQDGNGERVGVSTGADTTANTRGGGAHQLGDLCLLEDGGERGDALGSDAVVQETVNERRDEDGERAAMSRGADTKAHTLGWRRT